MDTHTNQTTIALVRAAVETTARTMYAESFIMTDDYYEDGRKKTRHQQGTDKGKLRGAIIIISGMLRVEYPRLTSHYEIQQTIHKIALVRGWTPKGLFEASPADIPVKKGGLYELLYSDPTG